MKRVHGHTGPPESKHKVRNKNYIGLNLNNNNKMPKPKPYPNSPLILTVNQVLTLKGYYKGMYVKAKISSLS